MNAWTKISAVAGLLAISAAAHANLLANGGFEDPFTISGGDGTYCYLGGGGPQCAGISAWTGNTPVFLSTASGAWGTPSSLSGFDAASFGGSLAGLQGQSSLEQTVTLGAGQYTLTWWDAGRPSYHDQTYDVSVGGSVLVPSFTTAAGQGWTKHTLNFGYSGGTVTVTFAGLSTLDATTFIDRVNLVPSVPVPEPGTYAMMLAGLGALGAVARRRRPH